MEVEPTTPHSSPALDNVTGEPPLYPARLRFIHGGTVTLLVVLIAGLGYQQVFRSGIHLARERRQTQRRLLAPAPRGIIYDRDHRVLAGNRMRTAAVLDLGKLRGEFRAAQRSLLSDRNETSVNSPAERPISVAARARLMVVQHYLDRVNAAANRRDVVDALRLERAFAIEHLTPFVLTDDLSEQESERLARELDPTDALQLSRSTSRGYPNGGTAAQVLGRVRREIMQPGPRPAGENFATLSYRGTIGESGLEKQYDAHLQGRPSGAIIQVDAWGFPVDPPLARTGSMRGDEFVLSLDLDLQLAAERAMAATPGALRGAAVAIAVETGEVLVLANTPGFDLNAVSPVLASTTKQRIDAEGGWLNCAVQGLYPPGSIFKIFTALAGLRGGTLHPDDVLHCDGFYEIAGRRFPCHNPAGHEDISLRAALARSCNVFAYQVGLAASPEALAAEARRFHFNELTGIDLPSETRGMLVPDPSWKQSTGHGRWTAGDTANFSIGQGFLLCSPLQAACAMASLARRETLTVPTLLRQPGRSPAGGRPREPLGISDADYRALIEGLQAAILTGTGREAQVPGLDMAGKTGTAQIMRKEGMGHVAWFVAFAPVEQPEIAIAVTIESESPHTDYDGGEYAAPVIREIASAYFDKRSARSPEAAR